MKKRHHYRSAEEHLAIIAIVLGTITLLCFCSKWNITDITGVIFFPMLFITPILRCAWDWLYAAWCLLRYASAYIITTIERGVSKWLHTTAKS